MKRPLILVSNDDGIQSTGIWAAVEALLPLGDVIVVAPNTQWSGAGRAMPHYVTGEVIDASRVVNGKHVTAYAVDASPALAVEHGILEFTPRLPDLVVTGVNYGGNMSTDITISGTVGAALEGAAFGVPALAVSLEMDAGLHLTGKPNTDYAPSIAYTRRFARYLLQKGMPNGVDVLNLNVPSEASVDTPWRLTHLSRFRYFTPVKPDRTNGKKTRPGYRVIDDSRVAEPNSDLRAVLADRMVSMTPLSLDMTAGVSEYSFEDSLTGELLAYQTLFAPMEFNPKVIAKVAD